MIVASFWGKLELYSGESTMYFEQGSKHMQRNKDKNPFKIIQLRWYNQWI